ncbi:MAG: sulfite exporter TauE/SafE family protein [Bacteriovoracaceae bacterium]|nr:sulfite exporter TauE/SafE family protein [Bacteriovoracaceae bacterium]
MSTLTLVVFLVGSLLTSVLSAVTGMGGGILLLSLMTFFLPLGTLIPLHAVNQLSSNSIRCFLLRKNVRAWIYLPALAGSLIGVVFSFLFLKKVDGRQIAYLIISLFIFYSLFKPKKLPSITLKKKGFFILGLVCGFLGPLVGAVGPMIAPFFLRSDLKKEEVVANKSCIQLTIHFLKIPTYYSLGFPFGEYKFEMLALAVFAFLGTKLGVKILKHIPSHIFGILFRVALFAAGSRLLYKSALSLGIFGP